MEWLSREPAIIGDFRLINLRVFRDECARVATFLEEVLALAEEALEYRAESESDGHW